MSLKDYAQREAVLKALYDAIGEELKAERVRVQAGIDEASETTGARQIVASLPDGTVVAKISLTDPKPEAKVTDADAFKAWVRKEFPSELDKQFVTAVRPAFETRVLSEMTAAGVAQVVDADGVIHTVPGVEIKATRSRTHSVRFEKTGRADVAEAWQRGELAHLVLPALTAGGDG